MIAERTVIKQAIEGLDYAKCILENFEDIKKSQETDISRDKEFNNPYLDNTTQDDKLQVLQNKILFWTTEYFKLANENKELKEENYKLKNPKIWEE